MNSANEARLSVSGYVILVLIILVIVVLCGILFFLRRASRVRRRHSKIAQLYSSQVTVNDRRGRLVVDVLLRSAAPPSCQTPQRTHRHLRTSQPGRPRWVDHLTEPWLPACPHHMRYIPDPLTDGDQVTLDDLSPALISNGTTPQAEDKAPNGQMTATRGSMDASKAVIFLLSSASA